MLRLLAVAVIYFAVYGYHQVNGYQPFSLHKNLRPKNGIHAHSPIRSISSLHMADTVILDSKDFNEENEKKKETFQLGKSLILHVYVDPEIREFLKMRNSERKARIILPQEIEKFTINKLRDIVEKKLPSLGGEPYILRYTLPGEMSSTKQFNGTHYYH
jgi:hypothetical protein